MAKRPNLTDITNVLNSASTHNTNNDEIELAFDNTLSRDGSTPNQMEADLDLNSNDLLNAGVVNASDVLVAGVKLVPASAHFIMYNKSCFLRAFLILSRYKTFYDVLNAVN